MQILPHYAAAKPMNIPNARDVDDNPDKWFGSVELVEAKDIGQETGQYVSNIISIT
jgi:hypothetical protein